MTTELLPLDFLCNLGCTYCYQNPLRDAGNTGGKKPYDFEKMFSALEREGGHFTVFGGEPLLVPIDDLEKIFAWGYERYKQNSIQTNGVLLTPAHIDLFKKYNVSVGFSIDGPDELNDSRWAGSAEKTRDATDKSHASLRAVLEAGISCSVIVTLYKGNGSPERLARLLTWFEQLDRLGMKHARIHLLEVDHGVVREKMQLSVEDTIAAVRAIAAHEQKLKALRFDIFRDMRNLLAAEDDDVTCIWNPCDPYTTDAVHGIDGQGNRTNCGRTYKDGIPQLKAVQTGYERQVILYHTPQSFGGCQGCRFFAMCKGQCPGTAIDGDWRNRSEHCPIWFALFEQLEAEMVAAGQVPLSLADDRVVVENALVQTWANGGRMSIKTARKYLRQGGVAPVFDEDGHADVPHGDEHGDHYDG